MNSGNKKPTNLQQKIRIQLKVLLVHFQNKLKIVYILLLRCNLLVITLQHRRQLDVFNINLYYRYLTFPARLLCLLPRPYLGPRPARLQVHPVQVAGP